MINESDTSKYRIEPRPINTTTTEKTLTVYNVTSSDVGTYTCNATNTIGTISRHGKAVIDSILIALFYLHILGCLGGMDYRLSSVQLYCSDFSSVDNCSNTTGTPGCFCSNGNVLEDGVCIPPGECPSKKWNLLNY